jgi:D-arabinose 1-dehydrogenase-like Zn-dependent alcohol dehydrogenase
MTNTMKAAVVRQFGQPLVIEEVPIPAPGPGEVLVKIKATGVCHTDLDAAAGRILAHIHKAKLEDINRVFTDLKAGRVDGRMVLELE